MTSCPRARLGAARWLPVLLLLGFSSAGFVAPARRGGGDGGPRAASSVDQEVLSFAESHARRDGPALPGR